MKKTFKSGQRVRLKDGSTPMYVLRYANINGTPSDYCVECCWYDNKWGYLTAIFHQSNLIRCVEQQHRSYSKKKKQRTDYLKFNPTKFTKQKKETIMETNDQLKPGDKVIALTGNSKTMEVIDYLVDTTQLDQWNYFENNIWNGEVMVECMWENELGTPHIEVFQEKNLIKVKTGRRHSLSKRIESTLPFQRNSN